jgi:subtilisin
VKPAWSWQFEPGALPTAPLDLPHAITPEWAWGDSTGAGVKVAVLDSGIDASHPGVQHVEGAVSIDYDEQTGFTRAVEGPHEDLFGHGTACAGIIRDIAPDVSLYSVRVLGKRLRGRGHVFGAGIRWAIEHGMQVVNMSLATTNPQHVALFHRLVDEASFQRIMLVAAISNLPGPSYPAEFSGVFSVASHTGKDPLRFDRNPRPPAEWGARGIDVQVPWLQGKTIQATGNSFAAPHIAGVIALILAKHPNLTPYEMKTVLAALASNASAPGPASPDQT